jgi:hypothetical protein
MTDIISSDAILSIAVLAVVALIIGGARLITKHKDRKKGGLMIGAAIVLLANILLIAWN